MNHVDIYRMKHKRCRTCCYADNSFMFWWCIAKNRRYDGKVEDYKTKGRFCKLYSPKPFKEVTK